MTEASFVPMNAVAKYFMVSESTVRAWMRQKRIPPHAYIHVGQTYRYNIPEIVKALTETNAEDKAPPNVDSTWGEISPDEDAEIPSFNSDDDY